MNYVSKNKITFLATCVLIVMFMLFNFVHASEVSFGNCGEGISWILDASGVLEISGSGSMSDYAYDSDSPWKDNTDIVEVVIENGVTNLGSYAFKGCSNLTSVTVSESVTTIGKYAFSGCRSLSRISIPANVTSIGDYAFYGCNELTSIEIPDRVTSIGSSAFEG